MQLARGPKGERITLTHDSCNRVVERRVVRNGFRPQIWRYEWDVKDRLIACVRPDGERWTYGYDPFGRRVFKINATKARQAAKAAGVILPGDELRGAFHEDERLSSSLADGGQTRVGTAYQWDGDNLAEEAPLTLDGTALWDEAVRWHYEPDGFRPLAKEVPDGKLLYIVTDHLGTPREMFSEDGRLQWAAEYRTWGSVRKLWRVDPDNDNLPLRNSGPDGIGSYGGMGGGASRSGGITYGNLALKDDPVWQEATLQCPIRFQGQWEDAETGLYYNRFRYYDPLVGQYVSPDPIGIYGGIRSQGYVLQPTTSVDLYGLKNLNSNDAIGNFGMYHIYVDGQIFKVGLADMDRVTKSSGLPTRLHQQIRKLELCYGPGRVTRNIKRLGRTSKKCAKQRESFEIAKETLKNGGNVPPGNSLSFFTGTATSGKPCLDGSAPPKGTFFEQVLEKVGIS